jgi:Circularly permutated YpsA SLOG family
MIEKIISGGQTGADRAGLDVGVALGIPTGGTAPKGWLIKDLNDKNVSCPELASYGLIECDEPGYPSRTRKNVKDADATLWVGFTDSPGGRLTLSSARWFAKTLIVNPTSDELAQKLIQHKVKILNVAGNRTSDLNPDIYQRTYDLLMTALLSEHFKN